VPSAFRVVNEGTSLLSVGATTLTGPNAGDFAVTSGAAPFAVAPGDSHFVEVTFAPTVAGAKTATLRIESDDPDEGTVDVDLAGNGLAPDISVDPASHDFGGTPVGVPVVRSSVVRNAGTSDLQVTATTLEGVDPADFAITAGGGPFVLAAGDSSTVEVTFAPLSPGPKDAVLRFGNDDPDENPFDVTLSGLGFGPDIAVTPTSHDFGGLLLGDSSSVVFDVVNEGSSDLAVTATTLVGVDAAEFGIVAGGGAATLTPGDTLSVEVSFQPSSLGAKTAALRVVSDDPDEGTIDADLTGTGVLPTAPDITVTPLAHDYGAVSPGGVAPQAFEVRNDGDADLQVGSVDLAGSHASEFSIDSGGGAFTLIPGGTRDVVVSFRPASLGSKAAALAITSDDADEGVVNVALSGTGASAPANIALEETQTGGSTASFVVSSASLAPAPDDLYLAAVSMKSLQPVTAVDGLGLAWTRLDAQCAGRHQTGIEVWMARGASGGGAVTATFADAPQNATIVVTRYSGVDAASPVGDIVSVNTNGVDGLCEGGADTAAYSLNLTTGTPGAWAYSAVSMRARTHTPGAGLTERADFVQGTGGGASGIAVQDRLEPTAGATVVDGSFNRSTDWGAIALEIRPGAPANAPDIAVAPSAHDFGSLVAGSGSATSPFTIRNTGNQTLDVTGTSIVGADAGEFAIVAGGGAATITPGDSTTVEVRFAPSSVGAKTAALRIASNDPDEDPFDVALTGTGVAAPTPDVAMSPSAHDYGAVPVTASSSRTFAILNQGSADLSVTGSTLTGPDAGEFVILSGSGAATVAPGDSALVEVAFQPSTIGAKSANLEVASDDPDEAVVSVSLDGTGAPPPAPQIAVAPASYDFGDVVADSGQATHAFQVHNLGDLDLSLTGTMIVGADSSEFAIISGGGPATITPGDSAAISVRFAPTTIGPKSAMLRITSDDPDDPVVDATLAGTGIDAPVGGGVVVFEQVVTGGSSGSSSVATTGPITGATGHLYVAAVATKSYRLVTNVTGLGLTWTPVTDQCSGRGQTGLNVWSAIGTPSGDGVVTATLESAPSNAVITVSRYSGVLSSDPIGAVLSGNTLGENGTCSGGLDNAAYSFDFTTTVDGAVVFGAATMRTKAHTPGPGFVERIEHSIPDGGNTVSIAVMDQTIVSPSIVPLAGSLSGSTDWTVVGLEIKPGAPAALALRAPDDASIDDDPAAVTGTTNPVRIEPATFEFTRLYPNPFRATTTIEYVLPEAAHVSVALYNAQGRLVRRLVDGQHAAGPRRVTWDARDTFGERVGPGVYFVRITTRGEVRTEKVVLRR
jgi:hypothetical protein